MLLVLASLAGADPSVPAGLGAIAALPSDPPPEQLTNDTHYLVSNERRLDLLRDDVADKGGVYLGVGAGQNYVLAGWAAPTFMVLIDFDQDVVDLHAIHGLFLSHADSGAAYVALWNDPAAGARVLSMLTLTAPRRARLSALYTRARTEVLASLHATQTRMAELDVRTYLDDPDQYARVAALARTGRIVAKRGDLTQPGVVAAVADTLRSAHARIGVLYLSNIEQYFMYGRGFRDNVAALPLDDDSVVLRTLPTRPAGFEYLSQRGDHLQTWVARKSVRSVYRIRGYHRALERPASTRVVLGAPPPRYLRTGKPK